MNVATNSTSRNGRLSSLIASSQANVSPLRDGLGGVCGSDRLNAASKRDATPAAMYVKLTPLTNAAPLLGVPSASPSQVVNPTSPIEGTRAQSVRMNTNGRLAAIQPMVPHSRTLPKSSWALGRLAKAMELVIEIVGT